jgi:hypothetical protein
MSKYNEQPNQVNGNETLMLQQSSFKETESKVYNVVLTICQITETHKCELTDNSLEVFNIFNMDYKIKNQINQLLKPSIILSKKITMPVIQDILYLDVQNNQNQLPIYAIELPICFTFFPDKKISRVKNKTKYILVMDAKDFPEIFKNKNAINLASKLRDIGNSKIGNPLQRFKDHLINFS